MKAIVSMSECTEMYAKKRLPAIPGTMVRHIPWMVICDLAGKLRIKITGKQKLWVSHIWILASDRLLEGFDNWLYNRRQKKKQSGGLK